MATLHFKNIPELSTRDDVELFLRPHMLNADIHDFDVFKLPRKDFANVTILGLSKAQNFLHFHGKSQGQRILIPLRWNERIVFVSRSSRSPEFLKLRSLKFEEEKRNAALVKAKSKHGHGYGYRNIQQRLFSFRSLGCGLWSSEKKKATFTSQYTDARGGTLVFGRSTLAVLVGCDRPQDWQRRMDIPYLNVRNVAVGLCGSQHTLTLTIWEPPKISKPEESKPEESKPEESQLDLDLTNMFRNMAINKRSTAERKQRIRVTSLSPEHSASVGQCFVYQFIFKHSHEMNAATELLNRDRSLPSATPLTSRYQLRPYESANRLRVLQQELASFYTAAGKLPFRVKFQIEKIVVGGYLPPRTVQELLPALVSLHENFGVIRTAAALASLSQQLRSLSPIEDAEQFNVPSLTTKLQTCAREFREEGTMYDLKNRHDHLALIHRVVITPAGYYLTGPNAEAKNRVLRKYGTQTDYFLRVVFADDDGQPLRFGNHGSPLEIYNERFKSVINGQITIGGIGFKFLGFSHSSLRSQMCWFMAPFVHEGSLIHAQEVVKDLGDFSSIQCPAKCAARIGQAFSDTTTSITVAPESVGAQLDVERNARVFSDGCSTISLDLLQRVWRDATIRGLKPTLLQVRFAGAKGMLSLDTRLRGEKMLLRKSMIKFEGTKALDIELCGSNPRPLPFYLNRQFIKILEDLDVPPQVFLDLQALEVNRLKLMTTNAVNAANYLDANRMCTGQRLPSLLKMLNDIGMSFQAEQFLLDAVELVALVQLRNVKHRARIPVENGVTLYGIMDETGILSEGEIYCVTETAAGGREVLQGQVVITRAPAMHPGDVQVVEAVDVPQSSPLSALYNCVVFSQHGSRDLPSQLSGGDLDGDLFNIVYDQKLMPKKAYPAADYPRVQAIDIGREVQAEDMTNFFIDFMRSDQLGRISNMHVQLADRKPDGTADPLCIQLAGLASTAVDFSKTGIPVNQNAFPKFEDKHIRPDFMAPGPRVRMTEFGTAIEDDDTYDPVERDAVKELDPSYSYKYYESPKVLGQLYRVIDESRFFADMQAQRQLALRDLSKSETLMSRVFAYIKREASGYQYAHYLEDAMVIRSVYDNNMIDTMWAFTTHPSHPLTEREVFSGTIVGMSNGGQSREIRELSTQMKQHYERDVKYTREEIVKGDDSEDEYNTEALPRAMACLEVGLEKGSAWETYNVESFKFVAAEVCLSELREMHGGLLRKEIRKAPVHVALGAYTHHRKFN